MIATKFSLDESGQNEAECASDDDAQNPLKHRMRFLAVFEMPEHVVVLAHVSLQKCPDLSGLWVSDHFHLEAFCFELINEVWRCRLHHVDRHAAINPGFCSRCHSKNLDLGRGEVKGKNLEVSHFGLLGFAPSDSLFAQWLNLTPVPVRMSTLNAKKLSDDGKMIDLETLRSRLADRNIMAVAKGAGVHPNALYRLMRSGSQPQYDTVRIS